MYGEAGRRADRLAEHVAARYGVAANPPLDVYALAARMGVGEIAVVDLVEDGRLERRGGKTRILLRAGTQGERLRFTLAHELAHLVVADHDDLVARRTRASFSEEERLCDAIAGGLLMPRRWVQANFARAPHRLSTVQALARGAEVSLSAALVRLREVCGWRSSLLRFIELRDRWCLDAEAGVFPEQQGLADLSESTDWVLRALRPGGRRVVELPLPLRLSGVDTELAAEVCVSGASAVALVRLPEPARPQPAFRPVARS